MNNKKPLHNSVPLVLLGLALIGGVTVLLWLDKNDILSIKKNKKS